MSAIVDSNVTTALTAAVLYQYGTGPVRGFAVTLLAGICALPSSPRSSSFERSSSCGSIVRANTQHTEHLMLRILHDTNYDFIRWWKWAVGITIAFLVIGLGSLAASSRAN